MYWDYDGHDPWGIPPGLTDAQLNNNKPLTYIGSQGDYVKLLQLKLRNLGYTGEYGSELEIDSVFGKNTKHAVMDYQRDRGLKVDGIVGNNTWASLKNADYTSTYRNFYKDYNITSSQASSNTDESYNSTGSNIYGNTMQGIKNTLNSLTTEKYTDVQISADSVIAKKSAQNPIVGTKVDVSIKVEWGVPASKSNNTQVVISNNERRIGATTYSSDAISTSHSITTTNNNQVNIKASITTNNQYTISGSQSVSTKELSSSVSISNVPKGIIPKVTLTANYSVDPMKAGTAVATAVAPQVRAAGAFPKIFQTIRSITKRVIFSY